MKKIFVLALTIILCLSVVGCNAKNDNRESNENMNNDTLLEESNGNMNNDTLPEESTGNMNNDTLLEESNGNMNNDTLLEESNGNMNNDTLPEESNGNMNNDTLLEDPNEDDSNNVSIMYQSSNAADRMFISSDWLNKRLELSRSENTGTALCVVTVVDIDLTNVIGDDIVRVPLKLKIDKIISKNNAFALKENETILTVGYSLWKKSDDSYVVSYDEGTIPITENNMQYIVILSEEGSFENMDFDVEYRAESYTLPILPNYNASAVADLCRVMQLPKDVRALSIELIVEEFGHTYIPSLSEVEEELKKTDK